MIPAIIHQTWKTNQLPPALKAYCRSWRRFNPEADYRFYDDAGCRSFVQKEFPGFLTAYEAFHFAIQRADLFRALAVYRFGGLYADVDMECLRPMERFFQMNGALFCIETRLTSARQGELGYRHPYQIANCIFAAEAEHPFLWDVIEKIARLAGTKPISDPAQVEDATGPRLLTRLFFDCTGEQPHILEQVFWMPPTLFPAVFPLNKNMFARHHFLGSWKGRASRRLSFRRRWLERSLMPNPLPAGVFHTFG
jgi:mannosyltransferase OCH1-like enzyme